MLAERTEWPGLSAGPEATRVEATHCRYKNTRVSVTLLKHHQGHSSEHILSFDVTDHTFEKEILLELIVYEEEDDTGVNENDESLPNF